ncbi:hypothetical protein XELAEV_18034143mg [Xenopus laevis]|uniref:Riboflavin transporter n=1 Tax=Xenopus laevis TaxID=8355 RepID=A0A974HEP6_XENLA|nr:hypothetical protein XELAEV_18034143mg [Xenopus laevis]
MALVVHLLCCLLGLGSWVTINGVWVELPLIVPHAPEGWELPSYVTLLTQFANIGPLAVTLTHKLWHGRLNEAPVIYLLLVVGAVACLLLTFLWHETTWVGGSRRSTALLALIFCLALVDCTSSVTFLPYMSRFRPDYLTTYFIGEGLSGLMPALVALGQGVGVVHCVSENGTEANRTQVNVTLTAQYQEAHFPVWGFFLFLTGMMATSLLAFITLNRMPMERGQIEESRGVEQSSVMGEQLARGNKRTESLKGRYTWVEGLFIFLVLGWVNALTNAALPAVQTYSCMSYGGQIYHLAVSLAAMANLLACGIAMYLPDRSLVTMGVLTVTGTGIGGYIMGVAVLSPCCAGCCSWGFSYVKVIIGVILRDEGHRALVWCGAVVQLGSMVGALTMFPLVNVYKLFHSGDPCSNNCPT